MEADKRKRHYDAVVVDGKKRVKAGEDGAETAVTEDEVEEFFAILRRIQVASKYLKKTESGREDHRNLTAEKWRPSFELEDFEDEDNNGAKEVKIKKKEEVREESVERISGLDLNSEPPVSEEGDDLE